MNIDVYIIAGQSNALGLSPAAELDSSILKLNSTLIYQSSNVNVPGNNQLINVSPGLGADNTKFGLEVGVARHLNLMGKRACLIKYASDGTSLYDRWRATNKQGEDFVNLLETVKRGIYQLQLCNFLPCIKGFLWFQGENDASHAMQAKEYKNNLKNFITEIRNVLKIELPFVIGQTNPNNKFLAYVKEVNAAQKSVAKEMRKVRYVKTSDINALTDNYHYNAMSELEIGKRMIQAL